MKLHYLVAAAAIVMSLTACDGSDGKWVADTAKGECLSVSREHNYIARVSPEGIRFFSLVQLKDSSAKQRISGCPANKNGYGFATVATSIDIDGTKYPSLMICHNGVKKFQSFLLGESFGQGEHSSRTVSANAMKSFSSIFGTDVNFGHEIAHFSQGNFSDVCADYLPHADKTTKNAPHKGILRSLFSRHSAEKKSDAERYEEVMRAQGYVRNSRGQWFKGQDQINRDAISEDVPDISHLDLGNVKLYVPAATNIDDSPIDESQPSGLPDGYKLEGLKIVRNDEQAPPPEAPDETIKSLEFSDHTTGPVNTFQKGDTPAPDSSDTQPAAATPSAMTPEMEAAALKDAQNTWLVSHPGVDISGFTWEKTSLPDKSVNGKTLHVLRFTTTDPQTHITSDVDVEIEPDGTPGYAISNDRPAPAPAAASEGVSAYCRLDNGKSISVTASDGQDYHYAYRDKNDQTELELTEGLFGVKAYHYRTQLGMGSASYIRFNKKQYDYVLISKDTGRQEFQGLKVYKDGNLISTHPCFSALKLDASGLTDTTHADSDKAGDFFTN